VTSILVTGAGGMIGARVAAAAERAGYDVTRLVRSPAPGAIAHDLTRPLHRPPPHDWVFHLAGNYAGASRRALKRADLAMAKNLTRWGGARNWVFASAAEVYGDVDGIAGEGAPTRPAIPYGEIKLAAEALFARMTRGDGKVVILRIGEVYDRHARLVRELSSRLKRGFCPWPGSGRVPVSFVHAEDVAEAFVRAVERAPAGVSIYNVADAEPATWREFLLAFAERLGTPPPVFLPRPLVRVYALGHSLTHALAGREPALTRHAVRLLTTPKPLSIDKIGRELGYAPRWSGIRSGLKDVLNGVPHHAQDGAAQGGATRAPA